jgi:hypothetical protein
MQTKYSSFKTFDTAFTVLLFKWGMLIRIPPLYFLFCVLYILPYSRAFQSTHYVAPCAVASSWFHLCRCNLPQVLLPGIRSPPLQIFSPHSPLCIITQMTDCYWSEESFTSLIGQITNHMREKLRSERPTPYSNNTNHEQNLRSNPGQAEFCMRYY